MSRRSLIPYLAATAALASTSARADFFTHHWDDQHEDHRSLRLAPTFLFYSTKSNYDATGVNVQPTSLDGYSRIQSDVIGAYGLNRYLSIYGRFSWAKIQVSSPTAAGDVFGPGDQSLGLTIRPIGANPGPGRLPAFALDLQFQADIPTYSNASAALNGTPFLGDGSLDLTGGGFLTVPIAQGSDRWILAAGIGFTKRGEGFSSALPWSAGLRYEPRGEGFYFHAGGAGFLSSKSDSATAARSSVFSTGAGGSFVVNAVNPSLLHVRGEAGYQMGSELAIGAIFNQTVYGQSAPLGFQLGVALTARWDRSKQGKNSAKISPQDYGRSNQGFVNYAFEARVVKASDRMNLVKIDKGKQDGVELGQVFDIFLVKQDGSIGEAIARANCTSVKDTEAALSVTEYYKEVWIEEGFVVKRPLQ